MLTTWATLPGASDVSLTVTSPGSALVTAFGLGSWAHITR